MLLGLFKTAVMLVAYVRCLCMWTPRYLNLCICSNPGVYLWWTANQKKVALKVDELNQLLSDRRWTKELNKDDSESCKAPLVKSKNDKSWRWNRSTMPEIEFYICLINLGYCLTISMSQKIYSWKNISVESRINCFYQLFKMIQIVATVLLLIRKPVFGSQPDV